MNFSAKTSEGKVEVCRNPKRRRRKRRRHFVGMNPSMLLTMDNQKKRLRAKGS